MSLGSSFSSWYGSSPVQQSSTDALGRFTKITSVSKDALSSSGRSNINGDNITSGKIKAQFIDVSIDSPFPVHLGAFSAEPTSPFNSDTLTDYTIKLGDSYYNTLVGAMYFYTGTGWSSTAGADGIDGTNGTNGINGTRGVASVFKTFTTTPTTTDLNNAIYSVTYSYPIIGDSVIYTIPNNGTKYAYYSNTGWVLNVAMYVHGNAIIEGTLNATEVFATGLDIVGVTSANAGYWQSRFSSSELCTLSIENTYVSPSTGSGGIALQVNGGSHNYNSAGLFVSGGTGSYAIYASAYSSASAIYANAGTGSDAVYIANGNLRFSGSHTILTNSAFNIGSYAGTYNFLSSSSTSDHGVSSSTVLNTQYGFYTNGKIKSVAYDGFTGSHIAFSKTKINIGDIICNTGIVYHYNVNENYSEVSYCNQANNKKVFGIASIVKELEESDLYSNTYYYNMEFVDVENEDVTEKVKQYIVKDEYSEDVNTILNEYTYLIQSNSLGEGGINVCSFNGNIETGDYITSSIVSGKGMKQNDDILHSYTVAKSLEDVNWDNEIIGENGCFEHEGYKCRMIACTYHCG